VAIFRTLQTILMYTACFDSRLARTRADGESNTHFMQHTLISIATQQFFILLKSQRSCNWGGIIELAM